MDHILTREQLEHILEDHRDFLRQLLKWTEVCSPEAWEFADQIKEFLRIVK